jgi:hypothetical protein
LIDTYSSGSKAASQSAAALVRNVQSIGTGVGGVALDLGSVAAPGWAVFINTDATNYVEIGSFVGGTFYPLMKLLAGEAQMVRLAVAAPYARANGASVSLFYIIYDT